MNHETQTFSQKLKRLEEIVELLEKPDVELEDGLKLLEEGVTLHQDCQKLLSQTQAKISKLLDTKTEVGMEEAATHRKSSELEVTEATLFENVEVDSDNDSNDGLPF